MQGGGGVEKKGQGQGLTINGVSVAETKIRITVLGAPGVGKTSLCSRFVANTFFVLWIVIQL